MPRKPKAPVEVKVMDLALDGQLLPPAPHLCQQCATDHDPALPHNQTSMFWQYWFYRSVKGERWPTWDDAMAHCTPEVQAQWKSALADVLAKRARATP